MPGAAVVSAGNTPTEVNAVNDTTKRNDSKDDAPQTITNKYLNKLYKDQPKGLDVRWLKKDSTADSDEIDETPEEAKIRRLKLMAKLNERRCSTTPMYGTDFHSNAKIFRPNTKYGTWNAGRVHCLNAMYKISGYDTSRCLEELLYTPERRIEQLSDSFDR